MGRPRRGVLPLFALEVELYDDAVDVVFLWSLPLVNAAHCS